MRMLILIISVFLCFPSASYAQVPDASVIIHQSTLNGFLNAIGPITGKDKYDVLGSKGEYTWTLRNARIELTPNAAQFIADADISVSPFSYSSVAMGKVEVLYHQETNKISVKVLEAVFEIYFKILGMKVHLADINAAKYYKPEFEFAGPQPIQPSVDVALPDGSSKKIYIKPVSQNLVIEQDRIVVGSKLIFVDHPITDAGIQNESK